MGKFKVSETLGETNGPTVSNQQCTYFQYNLQRMRINFGKRLTKMQTESITHLTKTRTSARSVRGVGNSPESSYTFGQNPVESQLFFS